MNGLLVRIKVVVRVKGLNEKAQAVVEALRPDDKTAPSWLRVVEHIEGGDLVLEVEAPLERLGSVRNTVNEILEFLYASLKTIEAVGRESEKETIKGRVERLGGKGEESRVAYGE